MAREIDRVIFLGAGKHSVAMVKELHDKLDRAVNTLCGLQQPGHPETEEQWDAEQLHLKQGEDEMRDHARDFVKALTGLEIDFREIDTRQKDEFPDHE